jgi:GWxTD domain-containing protein
MIKKEYKKWILSFLAVLAFCFSGLAFRQNQVDQEKQETEKGKNKPAPKMAEKYEKWLNEEVVYIISENEKDVFKDLKTDEHREGFIKTFWKRRDPTPDTPINEFREEHYRRIAFADQNYFEGKAGWRSDRGRVYIMFGPPDFFETNPGGGRGFLLGVNAPTAEFPAEVWTYREIPGLKERIGRVDFTFVNYYSAGSYQLVSNPALANALRNVSLPARYAGYNDIPMTDGHPNSTATAAQLGAQQTAPNAIEQLQIMAELTKSRGEVLEELERSERLRRLKGIVESKASLTGITFYAKENYLAGNEGLTYIPISLEVAARNLGFRQVMDRYEGKVNFYIEVKDEKGTAYQASDRLEMNLKEESYQRRFVDFYQYKQGLSLKPGKYFLHLVVWDEYDGNVGYADRWIEVPSFSSQDLSLSDIILARDIQRVENKPQELAMESKDIPALKALEKTNLKVPDKISLVNQRGGPFIFGNMDVNPNTLSEYDKDSDLMFFYQINNPTYDEDLGMAKVRIENQIWKGDKLVAVINELPEAQIPIAQKAAGALNSSGKYSLVNLAPGSYTLLARVEDLFSGKTAEKRIDFKILK